MKVFISWSGEESRRIGEVIRAWLPSALQSIKPYFSPNDIEKGSRWASEISKELAVSDVGLIILTPDNLDSNWIMFEAGSISRVIETTRVCPLLFGVEETDLAGPLAQFQAAKFGKEEFKAVFFTINNTLGDLKLSEATASTVFEKWWPDLEKDVARIIRERKSTGAKKSDIRTDRDLIEEILKTVRNLAKEADSSALKQLRNVTASDTRSYEVSSTARFVETLRSVSKVVIVLENTAIARELAREIDKLVSDLARNPVLSFMTKKQVAADLASVRQEIMMSFDGLSLPVFDRDGD